VSLCVSRLNHLIESHHWVLLCFSLTGDRLVWSAANAVIRLQMTTTWRRSPLMELFASQLWRMPAKLVYAFVFVHWMLIVVYTGNMLAAPALVFWGVYAATSVICLRARRQRLRAAGEAHRPAAEIRADLLGRAPLCWRTERDESAREPAKDAQMRRPIAGGLICSA
jgi:hypothetical protein